MLTVNELFAGIGSQAAALEMLGIDFKVVGIAEIDKYAIKSYEAIHGSVRNYGDISKIEKLDYADFWTYSFPCQDISVAGKQRGINENTRSGLLYEVERLLYKSVMYGEQPKWLMLENVKNLVGKKFKPQFEAWINRLDELGYNTYWKVLNAKNYGIPQNRERVFAISIRKDVDTGYEFPVGFDNGKRLKDVLESEVDEKYYLSNEKVKLFLKQGNINPSGKGMNGNVCTSDIRNTLTTNKGEGPKIVEPRNEINQIGMLDIKGNEQIRRVYADDGVSPTLNTMQGGNRQPKILELCIAASRGRNPQNPSDRTVGSPTEQRLEINKNGTSNTITTVQKDNYVLEPQVLTPKRTEYGKSIRKAYESGLVSESRHNMTEMKPREDGICNTLTTVQKDNYLLEPNIKEIKCPVDNNLFQNNQEYINNISDEFSFVKKKCQEMLDINGYLPDMFNPYNKTEITEIAPTQTTMCDRSASSATVLIKQPQFRIRKLTPLECWRLMGFTDDQFYKAEKVNSNSQLYKQAGNSIVVDVLYYLFKNLFLEN